LGRIHKILYILTLVICALTKTNAQITWEELYSFETGPIDKISLDTQGNLYLSDNLGITSKYDSLGNKLLLFSPPIQSRVSLLDGSRNVNVFLFYKNFQEVRILNRFLTEISRISFINSTFGSIMICTPSLDNNIWLIDESDLSLKKYSTQFKQILITNSLLFTLPPNKKDYQFTHFIEYNTNVYLSDLNQGIFVFDNLGNYKSQIQANGISHFGFYDNYIYYLEDQELKIIHLPTGQLIQSTLPLSGSKRILLNAKKAFLISDHTIRVLQHNIFP